MAMVIEGNGTPLRAASVQRNQPCPCGSGKKAKNCCGTETKYYHSGKNKKQQQNPDRRFIALYDRWKVESYFETGSLNDAIDTLNEWSEEGDCMPVAVIDRLNSEMVWFEPHYGAVECQKRVYRFLNKLEEEKK